MLSERLALGAKDLPQNQRDSCCSRTDGTGRQQKEWDGDRTPAGQLWSAVVRGSAPRRGERGAVRCLSPWQVRSGAVRCLPSGQERSGAVRCLPPAPVRSGAVPPAGTGAERCGTSRRGRCGTSRWGGCGAARCGTPRADLHLCVSGRRVRAALALAMRVPEPGRRAGLIRCWGPLLPVPVSAPAEREGAAIFAARPRPDHPGLLPPAPCPWALGSGGWRDGAARRGPPEQGYTANLGRRPGFLEGRQFTWQSPRMVFPPLLH